MLASLIPLEFCSSESVPDKSKSTLGTKLLEALVRIKQGTGTKEDTAAGSRYLRQLLQGNPGSCGACVWCTRKSRAQTPGILVNRRVTKRAGKGSHPVNKAAGLKFNDHECLIRQCLCAYASGKQGLVFDVGESTFVWHAEGRTIGGEWFKGTVTGYNASTVAHYMHFARVAGDGSSQPVDDFNDWVQLWRPDEFLKPHAQQNKIL